MPSMAGRAKLGELSRAIKTGQEKARCWIESLNVTRWKLNAALCLTLLLDMDAASAAAWALRKRTWLLESRVPQRHCEAVLQRALEDAILGVPASYCASWIDPSDAALGRSALRAATKASRDKRVRDWVAERNAVHGAAVSSVAVVRKWNEEDETLGPLGSEMGEARGPRAAVTQRVWCHRWRRRCGGQITFLRTREPLTLDAKREKAQPSKHFWSTGDKKGRKNE